MTGPVPAIAPAKVKDDTLRSFAGYYMKRAFNVVQADLSHRLKPLGLRMVTFSALVLIVDNPGLRQSHLADALAIERPNIVAILDELQRKGLIARDRAPDDRRAYALRATQAGEQTYQQAMAVMRDHEHQVFDALTPAEREALIATLRKVETRPQTRPQTRPMGGTT
jgi:DNA-binding MarR family transcriptional regulator